jgi:DNA-binding transcriptional LysR family regulator
MAERMSTESMRYVQAVAQTGSFSAAARAYGVTQPALSSGVAKLEERLGDRLFDRSPRGVSPTAFGARMLPIIDRALSALDEVSAEAGRLTTSGGETIRLGVSPLIDPALVAAAHRAVCHQPETGRERQLLLREADLVELHEALRRGELDLALIPSVAPLPGFEHRIVAAEPVVVVDSTTTADTAPLDLAEIEGRQLILVPDTCGLTTFTRDLLASREIPVRQYPGEAAGYRVLEDWARLGLGSALLPLSKVRTPAASRALVDGGERVEIFYEAVWRPGSALSGEVADLVARLEEQLHSD